MSSSEGDKDDHQSSSSEPHGGQNDNAPQNPTYDENFSDEEEREGRFYGPDTSWRRYTENERGLAATLDQAECNDLSIHLYNAHAWKRQHRDVKLFSKSQPWHSKQRWIRRDEKGNLPFLPHNGWTAWPMRPEDVPRSREQWGVLARDPSEDTEMYSKKESWRPSLDLQEELHAVVLRKAKERFLQRRWEDLGTITDLVKTKQKSGSLSGDDGASGPSLISNENDPNQDPKKLKKDETAETKPIPHSYTPVFIADDEAAGLITKPTVHHIITKLNDLLMGLQKSRRIQRKEPGAPRGRSSRSTSRSKSRSRTQSRPGTSSKRKRAVSDATQIAVEDGDMRSSEDENGRQTSRARSRSGGSESRQHALGLRDWSEVLGVAALTGWDQGALDRAARRCAAIFGETMSMRIMPETSAAHTRDEVVDYQPSLIEDLDMLSDDCDEEEDDEVEEEGGIDANVMAVNCCPFIACSRHEEPYEKRYRLREHLKRNHGMSLEEIDAMEAKISIGKTDPDDAPEATTDKIYSDDVSAAGIGKNDTNDIAGPSAGRTSSKDVPVKAEPVGEENVLDLLRTDEPAVRRDGFLESIVVPIRRPGSKRRKRKSQSSTDS